MKYKFYYYYFFKKKNSKQMVTEKKYKYYNLHVKVQSVCVNFKITL